MYRHRRAEMRSRGMIVLKKDLKGDLSWDAFRRLSGGCIQCGSAMTPEETRVRCDSCLQKRAVKEALEDSDRPFRHRERIKKLERS